MSLHEKVMDMIGIKWDSFTRKIIRYLINWKPIKFKKMPVFYICNFTGCFTTWALMYNAFFLQMSPDAIKKHLSIIAFEAPSDARNWVFILLRKFMKNFSLSDFFSLNRYTYMSLMWSFINVTNHHFLDKVVTSEALQTSLCTIENGLEGLYVCKGKDTWWCFASLQVPHINK